MASLRAPKNTIRTICKNTRTDILVTSNATSVTSDSLLGSGSRRLPNNRSFVLYLCARALATVGVQIQGVAVGWQVYSTTGSFLDLGFIGLAQFAPFFILVLPAGYAADRYDRRKLIISCFLVQLLCATILLAFSTRPELGVWPVFLALALQGCARAISMPASQAFLTNIVPPEAFGRAVALSSSTFHVAVVLGPTLGGALYVVGPRFVYSLVCVLLLLASLLLLPIRALHQSSNREPTSLRNLLEGIRYVWSRKVILGAISLDLFAVLLGGSVALLPAFARDVVHADATGLGLLRTAPGIGAAGMSALLAVRPIKRHVGRWMFSGVAVFGLSMIVLGLTDSLALAFVTLAVSGAGDMVSVYVRHILVQVETPDDIRGRVSAVNSVFIGASNELGEFESGLMAQWLGLVPAIMVGGIATLVVTAACVAVFRVLTVMDRFPHEASTS